ncbi:MAG TPA: substrate-binding domain-containing protein [Polyangiaceae bacterium]|nr:substrate-binding domain-containing protein [Polyangiaceae bacterium]
MPIGLAVLACGASDDQASTDELKLAFIPKASNNLVFKLGYDGAKFAARSLNHAKARQVNVEYLASPTLDRVQEQSMVRQAIAAKKSAILVSCIDESLTEPIDEAVDAGIPVITYDSDCPNSKRLGFYSMDNEDAAGKGADLLAQAMGTGKKTVAILTGHAGADNLNRRVNGFVNRLAAMHPEITVVATAHCAETAESCGRAVEDELVAEHPDLDGLFVAGLWGLQSACTCSDTGMACTCDDEQMPNWKSAARGKLKTVALDSLPFELTLVSQGYVSVLLGQKYFGWGYDTVSLMYDHLTTDSAVSAFVDSGVDVVCPNNVANMTAKWDAADFSTPLTPDCAL